LNEWRSSSFALPCRFGYWWGGGAPPLAERQLRPTVVLFVERMAERQFRPTLPDLDIGRAAVPRRQWSGSSALPGVLFVERMAERQLRPTGFGLWWGGSSALPMFLVTSSPMNLMHTSKVRPILRLLHQTLSHRILADVLPLLRVTLAITHTMMKAAVLKSSGVRMRFGEAVLPEPNPTFDGEFQIARRAKQMQMIRHQQVIAHQPGRGRVLPDAMKRALD